MAKNKKNSIELSWDWKIIVIIILVIGIFLMNKSYTILETDYYNLEIERNNLISECINEIDEGVFCEDGSTAYCFSDDGDGPLQCDKGSKGYCFREDRNVGACMSDERILCQ